MGRSPMLSRVFHAAVRRSPWFVRQAEESARLSWSKRRQPFSGVYERYEDVAQSDFYDSDTWAQASATATKAVRNGTHSTPNVASRALLPSVINASVGPTRVLDFGGATGIDFAFVASGNKNATLSYTVVDTPAACSAGRELWRDDHRISFQPDMPPPCERFDIVYSCVSLHALPDPMHTLRQFTDYRPRVILLVRHPFAERAFVRQQVNMQAPLAQWVLSLPDTVALMQERDYELRMDVASEDNYNVDNFPTEYAVPGTRNLMFVSEP